MTLLKCPSCTWQGPKADLGPGGTCPQCTHMNVDLHNNTVPSPTAQALAHLAAGPPEGTKTEHLILHINTPGGPQMLDVPGARRLYYPSAAAPTHMLVWSRYAAHCIDYHCVEAASTP